MKILTILLVATLTGACSFKSQSGGNDPTGGDTGGGFSAPGPMALAPNGDADGDLVTNAREYEQGRNPLLADLPALHVAFLQNYKISVKGEGKSFVLDTKIAQTSPDFRYRVGSLFIQDHALTTAASVGKFSSHTQGELAPHDLTWVKYPEIDQHFFQKKALEYQKLFEHESPSEITLTFENNIRLHPTMMFPSVKNVKLNFYYYDYEAENYVLLKSTIIEKTFLRGINETVTVQIDNVPTKLLVENYFKKGEFIFSEVADFEIPEMGVTYQQLLASVKAHTLPIAIITPKDLSIFYVGVDGGAMPTKSFAEVLGVITEKNFKVENDEIKKIGEFENNLPDFTYLKDVKDKDKAGKWFILTSPFTGHYIDHRYSKEDYLVLIYATGTELAQRTEEKLHGIFTNVTGGDSFWTYPMGTLSPNSRVDLEIFPGRVKGEHMLTEERDYHERPGSCGRNCLSGILEIDCLVTVNFFQPFDEQLEFKKTLEGEISQIKIMINKEDFTLQELIGKKAISLSWDEENHLHLSIPDPSLITELHQSEENLIALKVETKIENVFQGAKLTATGGRDANLCPAILAKASMSWRVPVSESSIMMDQFRVLQGRGLITLPDKVRYTHFNFSMSSLVTNFYN